MVRLALDRKTCLRTSGPQVYDPESVAAFVTEHYGCEPQEVMLALALNPRNEVLHVQEISRGGLDVTAVDPRVVFAGAILAGASAVILVHNHPSGDPEPSQADVALTGQLRKGGELLSIRVIDHLVIARGGKFTSFQQRGLMRTLGDVGDEEQAPYGLEGILPMLPMK
jgi:DNA repair protein RadC